MGDNRFNRYSDSYDAMAEDFSTHNTYSSGVKYSRDNRDPSGVKLFISNIPLNLTESGLTNIFSSAGFEITSPYVGKADGKPMAWGFVTVKSHNAALEAMKTLHRVQPHYLNVEFSREKGEKPGRSNNFSPRQDNFSPRQDNFDTVSMHSASRGRGMMPLMEAKPLPDMPLRKSLEEPFFGENNTRANSQYSQNRFMPPSDMYDIDAANEVNSKSDSMLFGNGQRTVTMGRGSQIAPPDVPSPRVSMTETRDDLDTLIASYISRQFNQSSLSADDNMKMVCNSKNPLSIIFNLGQCVCCGRPSLYVCSKCKAWYCSNTCKNVDFSVHKAICIPRKVVSFDTQGKVRLADMDEFAGAEEFSNLTLNDGKTTNNGSSQHSNPSSHQNRRSQVSPGYQPNSSVESDRGGHRGQERHEEPYCSNGQGSFHEDKRENQMNESGVRGGARGKEPFDRRPNRGGGDDSNRGGGDDNNRGGDFTRGPNRSGGDNRNPPNHFVRKGFRGQDKNNDFAPDDFNYEAENRHKNAPTVRNDKRIQVPRVTNVEDGVYKRPVEVATKPQSGYKNPGSSRSQAQEQEPPIPFQQFSDVMVTALCNEKNVFWGHSMSKPVLDAQNKIMSDLKDCNKARPLTGNIVPGLRVSAPYDGDRYRAVVKSVEPGGYVKLLFLDFGNETSVEKNVILPLPQDIESLPVLAHRYVLAASPNNPTIAEGATIFLMPVKQIDGVWVSHAEGVKYRTGEEVTVVKVTDISSNGQLWVRNMTDEDIFVEMFEKLGEHQSVKISTTKENEIYAHQSMGNWYRSKVTCRAPLQLFEIDTGSNSYNVQKAYLHPLPVEYTSVPPLAYKITLDDNSCYSKLTKEDIICIRHIKKAGPTTHCEFLGKTGSQSVPKSGKRNPRRSK